ncbi:MAG: 2-hydroxy-3-oxopropionate reductase [uncultured Acidimicrobiales bacterium]|uniref:2-hydroxy-3-oxopropionate reductase n=1 Tax=uncultured Acidimicrobiales bacterium TaxID=310071 RepID=A0A6J4I688_9ACTN|nr:MAG: 2-hydroxy-3-oxopropionate reductase [uncultured Acidimicrobiales bacterium]
MTKAAFCGLGRMGVPMAARLLEAGHDVAVWNRTPERGASLVENGASQATSPAEAAAGAEVVITMLADPQALELVVFGEDGVAAGVRPGCAFVEMSTIGVDAVLSLAARLPDGVDMLDAPVLGSVPQATDGTLKIFVGGDETVLERCRPVLEAMGTPRHLGALGAGAAMKLVANSTLGVLMCGLAEALALADALGLEEAAVLDVLAESPIGATVKSKRTKVESGVYEPNFTLALAAKDLGLVTSAAEAAALELRLAPAAQAWLERAATSGLGDLDYSAVIADVRGRPASGGSPPT